jgi:hypothetical protein
MIMRTVEISWAIGFPLLTLAFAIYFFVKLISKVKRGHTNWRNATGIYFRTVLFPFAYFFGILFLSWWANAIRPLSIWNGDSALAALIMPGALLAIVVLLNFIFWIALLFVYREPVDERHAT